MDNKIQFSEYPDISTIEFSCQGRSHGDIGRQDSSIVYRLFDDKYTLMACSDGHSCAQNARLGADYSLKALVNILENSFDSASVNEERIVSFLISIRGKKAYFSEWKRLVGSEEEIILRDYGTTINAFIITPNYIVTYSVGDGAIALINNNGEIQTISEEVEGILESNVTYSVCECDPSLLNARVFLRDDFSFVIAVTDGISKTYNFTENYIPLLMESYSSGNFETLKTDIEEFVNEQAVNEISDDYSMVFACFNKHDSDEIFLKDSELIRSLLPTQNSLLYGAFSKEDPEIGRVYVGIGNVLSIEQKIDAAISIIEKIGIFEETGGKINFPIDALIKFSNDENIVFDVQDMYIIEDDHTVDNDWFNRICNLYNIYDFDKNVTEYLMAGIVYKLIFMEELSGKSSIEKYLSDIYNNCVEAEYLWDADRWIEEILKYKRLINWRAWSND